MIRTTSDTGSVLRIGQRRLAFSNLEKVLYPSGFTKGEVISYYLQIAPVILPHLKSRAVTLKRYPNGTAAPFFFEKHCASHRPAWVKTSRIVSSRGEVEHCLINDAATLLWAANLAALELHVPLAKADHPERPTSMVFDLDPGPQRTLLDCMSLGLRLRDVLERLGLESCVKTSGGKGLHVLVPLNTSGVSFEDTKSLAHALATVFERENPKAVTATMAKEKRAGRIFIDWSQNDQHKTTVCAYSLRAQERPLVSTPVAWEELETALTARRLETLVFTAQRVLERVQQQPDGFALVLQLKQRLPRW